MLYFICKSSVIIDYILTEMECMMQNSIDLRAIFEKAMVDNSVSPNTSIRPGVSLSFLISFLLKKPC